MTYLVPFDGSPLSEAALERAAEFADFTDERLLAVTVVPPDPEYARRRGWLAPDEALDVAEVADRLAERVAAVAPEATFRYEGISDSDPVATVEMDVTRAIRRVAADVGADVLFVGSENAGRVSSPLTSVGNPISEDPDYDVFIVRHVDRD